MSAEPDVKLTVTGLPGVQCTGISLNFTAGAIPVCMIDMSPSQRGGDPKISGAASGVLSDPDHYKRNTVTVDVTVTDHFGESGTTTHKLNWAGLLDGISVSNNVGNNTFQAVVKGNAQKLLELTTLTPGLNPSAINIYKMPTWSTHLNPNAGDQHSEQAWASIAFSEGLQLDSTDPIAFYVRCMRALLNHQLNDYEQYLGNQTDANAKVPLAEMLKDSRYKKAIAAGIKLLDQIDLSAVNSGSCNQIALGTANVGGKMKDFVLNGGNSTTMLENMMNFFSFLGCTMVFGNDKIFVVPDRSFIKQTHNTPGVKAQSTTPNQAYPADYNGFAYNDNGYRDVMGVIVSMPNATSGTQMIDQPYDAGLVGSYKDEKAITNASGVLIIRTHPWELLAPAAENNATDSKELKHKADSSSPLAPQSPQKYGATSNDTNEKQQQQSNKKKDAFKSTVAQRVDNYAQSKLYQARYGDRRGTITLSFNPKWVPGASGSLYIRQTNFWIDFWVESVTHRIEQSVPASGTAITIVNFCCGRMGTTPIGVDSDPFFGYDKGKEKEFMSSFVSDIKGN